MADLVDRFALDQINRAPARFDLEKCKWMNQQHIAQISPQAFADYSQPFVESTGLPIPENFSAIAAAVKDKVRLFSEVPDAISFLVQDEISYDAEPLAKVKSNAAAAVCLKELPEAFSSITPWSADAAKEALSAVAQKHGSKPGALMFPLRVALSGRAHGPDLGDILNLLGKDRCCQRLRNLVSTLDPQSP
jgi:glutamyl-tRNA synthetase